MPSDRPTLEPGLEDLEYVGFWIRFAASLIDSVLLMLLIAPIGYLLLGTNQFDLSDQPSDLPHFLLSAMLPAFVVIVFWNQRQSTPGKMLFRARIIDATTGAEPRTGQWMVRYLGYYLSAFVAGLGFIWVAFDRRKQGWHDKIAGTVVVRARRARLDPPGIER